MMFYEVESWLQFVQKAQLNHWPSAADDCAALFAQGRLKTVVSGCVYNVNMVNFGVWKTGAQREH